MASPGRRPASSVRRSSTEVDKLGEEVIIKGVRMECPAAGAVHANPPTRLAHVGSAYLVKSDRS
jgi:hypothetical protein